MGGATQETEKDSLLSKRSGTRLCSLEKGPEHGPRHLAADCFSSLLPSRILLLPEEMPDQMPITQALLSYLKALSTKVQKI